MKRLIAGLLLISTSAYAGPFIAPNVSADGVTLQMRGTGELFCNSTASLVLAPGTTATTQTAGDNTTLVATDAFVTGNFVPYTGATANVNLGAHSLTTGLDSTIHTLTIGLGLGSIATNTALGASALAANTTGVQNTATGDLALTTNTIGTSNTATGYQALSGNTIGTSNTATGYQALRSNTTGFNNTATGFQALTDLNIMNSTGNNTAIGSNTGRGIVTGTGNTILGAQVTGLGAALTNNIILANGTGAIEAQHDGTNWALTGNVAFTGIEYSTQPTPPTATSCGSSQVFSAGATDESGTITVTGVATTGCVLNFNITHVKAPICVINIDSTIVFGYMASSTTTTATMVFGSLTNPVLNYVCR